MNIAVFASHNGSGLQAIIDACNSGRLNAKVCAVFSNNSSSMALQRARDNNIPAYHMSQKVYGDTLDSAQLEALEKNEAQVIFLAGYLKKLGPIVLDVFENRVFNIHPSLLPKYGGKGMYGINVHTAVLEAGETETGITIHRVNTKYDDGEIIAQRKVPVLEGDTPELLAARVLAKEHTSIVETLEVIFTIVASGNHGIFRACIENNTELARNILDKGINPNIKNQIGWTPLLLAVEHSNIDMVNLLLCNGADINFQTFGDFFGWSALHHAVSLYGESLTEGQFDESISDLIVLLLEKGANADLKDKLEKSPRDYAKMCNSEGLIKILECKVY